MSIEVESKRFDCSKRKDPTETSSMTGMRSVSTGQWKPGVRTVKRVNQNVTHNPVGFVSDIKSGPGSPKDLFRTCEWKLLSRGALTVLVSVRGTSAYVSRRFFNPDLKGQF